MSFLHRRKFFYFFAALLLTLQLVSMFFCGDAECLQGGPDENCDALICALLAKHATANTAADGGQSNSCQCVCHLLIALPKITLNAMPLATTRFYSGEALRLVSSPIRSIYHPPLV